MLERLIQLSISKRWLVLFLVFCTCIFGVWNFQRLAIDAVPDITNIQVQINTNAAGYSPLEVEQRVTFPVETALAGLPQLSYTRSLSAYGLSQVTVVFDEGTDLYFARNLVSQKLTQIKSQLPINLIPEMGPIATGLGEIFMYTVRAEEGALQPDGKPYDGFALREIQDWIIKRQLILVKGVTEINTSGGFDKQYQVLPDPSKLLRWGITMQQVVSALWENNENRGAGYIERNGQQLLVRSTGQLRNIADIENVVLVAIDSIPVRIKDVADVVIGSGLRTGAATRDGKETVLGTIFMLAGENSRSVAQRVADKLREINQTLPIGVKAEAVYDRTALVDKAIATVQKNLLEGALLVILVLFVLLGNLRAALVTALVIPITMLGTISGMVNTGVSANLMSLGALDFGLIVDGSVIIVENAIRRLAQVSSQKDKPLTLHERLPIVFAATSEVIRPSLIGIAIITLVYLPVFTLSGIEGKMFHPMAITVVLALSIAMLLSITFVPAAVACLVTGKISDQDNIIIRVAKSFYQPVILFAIKLRWLVISLAFLMLVASTWLANTLGTEFIPQLDEGDITIQALRVPGTGLQQAIAMQDILERRIKNFAEVDKVFSRIGTSVVASDPMPPSIADVFVILHERSKWPNSRKTKAALVVEMELAVSDLPGNNYEFTQPIQMRFNELISGIRSDLGIMIFGDDLDVLSENAEKVLHLLEQVEGVADARIEQVAGLPMLTIKPKREVLSRYGLNIQEVQNFIATAIGGSDAGLIYDGDRQFKLQVRLPEAIRSDINHLESLPVSVDSTISSVGYVPLSELVEMEIIQTPNRISRENGMRKIVVSANVRERDLGSFVTQAKQTIASGVKLPAGYFLQYGGTFQQLESASKRLSLVVPATLILIFILLLVIFSSLKDAIIIFTGVPLALTGGVLSLWLRGMPLSITAGVGFIALSGIAVLNGLVMLSFIRNLVDGKRQARGSDTFLPSVEIETAIFEGAMTRLRPVLMTALVASLGFVPMALNTGIGAEVQRPLATVVIGGIITSTLLTLVVLPAMYRIFHSR